jgi:hypothetical protein
MAQNEMIRTRKGKELTQSTYHLRHILPDHNPQNIHLLQIRRELIIRHDPPFSSEERLDPLLLEIRVFFFDFVREAEGYDGETFNVGL